MIADFHFIRPLWLLALIPLALLWFLLRSRTDAIQPWRRIISPNLLPHLLDTHLSIQRRKSRIQRIFIPLNLISFIWLVSVITIAGPTWHREPSPFSEDAAALAIVIRISDTMKTGDVQPSRLARATEKIHDLLALRPGAKTILIAYAGSAHTVMPATTDSGIIDTFAQALDPRIMPVHDGDAALQAFDLATRALSDAGGGSILWITDSLAPDIAAQLATRRKADGTPVIFYPPLLPGNERDTLANAVSTVGADLALLTPDDTDVRSLARAAKFAEARAPDGSHTRWAETGYWLTPFIALLLLPFFRRGWMLSTAAK